VPRKWIVGDREFNWGSRTYLMGVINLTPDSFSDGGIFNQPEIALKEAEKMFPYIDILDLGGESTRPGALPVDLKTELERVIPVIKLIRQAFPNLPISIDTTKADVAHAAIEAGANLINDVSAGRFDSQMFEIAAKFRVPIFLMHMQGKPQAMQTDPKYENVVEEVFGFLKNAMEVAEALGLPKELVAIDPGIGFGKSLEHNLLLLRHLERLQALELPILVGVSRKSFIGKLCDRPDPNDRLLGTAAACTASISKGADILRVHDPKQIKEVCQVADAIYRANISGNLSISDR
jgi:dihydropteroate synthase